MYFFHIRIGADSKAQKSIVLLLPPPGHPSLRKVGRNLIRVEGLISRCRSKERPRRLEARTRFACCSSLFISIIGCVVLIDALREQEDRETFLSFFPSSFPSIDQATDVIWLVDSNIDLAARRNTEGWERRIGDSRRSLFCICYSRFFDSRVASRIDVGFSIPSMLGHAQRQEKRSFLKYKGRADLLPAVPLPFCFCSSSEERLRIFLARLISQSGLPVERAIPPPRSFEISLYGSRKENDNRSGLFVSR